MADQDIIDASNAVRDYHFDPATPAARRLTWVGFKARNDEAGRKAFFDAAFAAAKGLDLRYPTALTALTSKMDYGAWFNYFFSEAQRSAGGAADNEMYARIFSLVFDYEVVGLGAAAKLKPVDGSRQQAGVRFRALLQDSPGNVPKSILEFLFKRGFEQAEMADADKMFSPALGFAANLQATPDMIKEGQGHFVFAYRGDKRAPSTVVAHGGAQCRASLSFWREDAQVGAAWHPWSSGGALQRQMWFRKGNRDNDYFTLNSMAYDFHISCAYPIFRSAEMAPKATGPVSTWKSGDRGAMAAHKVEIVNRWNRVAGAWEEVLQDSSNVYVCMLRPKDQVATTWSLNGYPESGVRNVNVQDILAWLKIVRIHHPPAVGQPYDSSHQTPTSMTVRIIDWGTVQPRDVLRAGLGCTEDGMNLVFAKLDGMKGKEFDITHQTLVGGATRYDTTRFKPVAVAKPVKI